MIEDFRKKPESQIEDAEIIPQFKGVKSWEELSNKLSELDLTTSAGERFTAEDLKDAVDIARETRFQNLRGFTSNEGLREAAACLFISEANDVDELSSLLKHIATIDGSSESYTQEELRARIQRVLDGEDPAWITSAYNLRQAVLRLKDQLT